MDARTSGSGPSAEEPCLPQRHLEQLPARKERTAKERKADDESRDASRWSMRSFAAQLRAHWVLATAGACLLLIAVIGGTVYWLDVRDFESTDDAFVAARSFSVAPKVGGYVAGVP